jgi:hypothetical protein
LNELKKFVLGGATRPPKVLVCNFAAVDTKARSKIAENAG